MMQNSFHAKILDNQLKQAKILISSSLKIGNKVEVPTSITTATTAPILSRNINCKT